MTKKTAHKKKQGKSKHLIRFDWAIKTVLRSKKNFPILEGFLSELLKTTVMITALLESESNKDRFDDKLNRVDILAELTGGERVIIEVQCLRQWDFLSRMLFGTSKVIIDHLKEGDAYGKIPRVISVNIVYFELGEGQDYIYHGTTVFRGIHKHDVLILKDKEKSFYPPSVDSIEKVFPEYYVLKVAAFDMRIRDTLDEWVYALKESEVKPEFSAKGIQEAGQALDLLQLPDNERVAYERHIGDVRDAQSLLHTYFYDGKAEGREEGREEGVVIGERKAKLDLARALESQGIALAIIRHVTGLDVW